MPTKAELETENRALKADVAERDARIEELLKPSGDNNKLIPDLQAKVEELAKENAALREGAVVSVPELQAKIDDLVEENNNLRAQLAGREPGEGGGKGRRKEDKTPVVTARPRMAGVMPANVSDMPTLDEVNRSE